MELFLLLVGLVILAETTYITIRTTQKPILNNNQRRKVFVDTSALIDGRMVNVAKSGFFGDELFIPSSVIRELQLLADGKDSEKRSRARFGLDNVNELERVVLANVEVYEDELDRTPVDDRLIELAKKNHGLILTNDYNLNKVATAEGIDVLNINDLALAIRTEYLPGEKFHLKINSVGSNPKQGVGHLPDGTMVVVDNAAKKVGTEIDVQFIRFLQTSSGRMMFAKMTTIPKEKQLIVKRKKTTKKPEEKKPEEKKEK